MTTAKTFGNVGWQKFSSELLEMQNHALAKGKGSTGLHTFKCAVQCDSRAHFWIFILEKMKTHSHIKTCELIFINALFIIACAGFNENAPIDS